MIGRVSAEFVRYFVARDDEGIVEFLDDIDGSGTDYPDCPLSYGGAWDGDTQWYEMDSIHHRCAPCWQPDDITVTELRPNGIPGGVQIEYDYVEDLMAVEDRQELTTDLEEWSIEAILHDEGGPSYLATPDLMLVPACLQSVVQGDRVVRG